jgi:hypothetical protein
MAAPVEPGAWSFRAIHPWLADLIDAALRAAAAGGDRSHLEVIRSRAAALAARFPAG